MANSALIELIDRGFGEQDAETESDQIDRSNPQCMEDHVLVAAVLDSESAAARSETPCSAESIDPPDHRALLLAELGAAPKVIAAALAARPGLTPEEIRASWAHFEQRIAAGRCKAGAFFDAIKRGQLHNAPPDPQRPLDPQAYADDPGFRLGSDVRGLAPDVSPPASAPPIAPRARSAIERWN